MVLSSSFRPRAANNEIIVMPLVPPPRKPTTPLPQFQTGILMMFELVETTALMSIYPYINQLIREFDITGGDDAAVGYYVGLIDSLLYLAQALTVLSWSRLSDRIGRRPVLLMGLTGACISMICFGLSTTFWSLVIRFASAEGGIAMLTWFPQPLHVGCIERQHWNHEDCDG